MLARYADHLIHGSGLIWNPGGPPTYGLTSVLYIGPVASVQSILPHRPLLTLALTSFLCGCVFLVLLGALLRPFLSGASRALKVVFGILIVVSFGRASVSLAEHLWSGMDTMFDLAMMTGYLLIARWQEGSRKSTATWAMGVAGGLMYGARPDLLIYTFLIPVCMVIFGNDKAARMKAWLVLAITGITTSLVLTAAYFYFGSALPLSFYAKGLKLYGDFEYENYRKIPFEQLADYVESYGLLFGVIAVDYMDSLESRTKTSRGPLEIALLCGTALYCFYYLFFVLQVMYFNSRFYYPTLPAVVWLAAASASRLVNKYSEPFQRAFRRGRGWGWATALCLAGILLVGPSLASNAYHFVSVARQGPATWDELGEYRTHYADGWFRLDRLSALPSDLTIATTEIGHVGVMNPGKVVVDMAGLNEIRFARHPFSSAVLIHDYHPDLIYMPHPGYRSMIRDLLQNPQFVANYEYFPAAQLGATVKMGLALRRDSKYYQQMRAIVTSPT